MIESRLRKLSLIAIIVCAGLTTMFGISLKNLSFDYNLENFFPSNNEETEYFVEFREKFGSDNDFILIAIENAPSIFDTLFLNNVDRFTQEVDSLENVNLALSITNQSERIIRDGFNIKKPYYSRTDSLLNHDSTRIFSHPELIKRFVAQNGQSVCLFVSHKQYLSKKKCDELVAEIKSLLKKHDLSKFHLSGRAPGQSFYTDSMKFEMILLSVLSFILILAFLAFTYKSLWGVWVSLTIISLSILWVLGTISILGKPLNLTMTILPSIIFIVATSDVIHLVSKYIEKLRHGQNKVQAIIDSYKEVGLATLFTSITTGIGFISLVLIDIKPIQDFGIYSAYGVGVAFLLTYTLLPGLLYFSKTPSRVVKTKQNRTIWDRLLKKLFPFTVKNAKPILLFSIILILLSGIGLYQLEINNYILDDLSDEEQLKQDFNFMDEHYGGVRPFEMGITIQDTTKYSSTDQVILDEIQKIETYLEQEYQVENLLSINKTILLIHKSFTGKQPNNITQVKQKKREKYIRVLRKKGDEIFNKFVQSNTIRISGQLENIGNIEVQKRNQKLQKFIESNINKELISTKLTGSIHLSDYNLSFMSKNLLEGILIALAAVSIIMGIIFKSTRAVFLSLIPNCLPLILVGAIMGFFDIDIKFTTAIIFTIAFGIAVDDTIHFMSKFKMELSKRKNMITALKNTYLTTGRAIILTSIILVAGFMLMVFSSFKGTFYVGTMVSLALLFAVLADLLILPALIVVFFKKKPK